MAIFFGDMVIAGIAFAGGFAARKATAGGEVGTAGEAAGDRTPRRLPPPSDADRIDLATIDAQALADSAEAMNAPVAAAAKRFCDIVCALLLLLVSSPVMALTAMAIRLETPGPVLYRQARVGRAGAVFQVYKLRSMCVGAEPDGACYASVNDHRITRVGRIIRRLRVDEIPQALNVLKGDMSFIGPRPERPEFVAVLRRIIPHYDARHLVKPGLTGWAQVKYHYADSVEGAREKLRYDLFYITRHSPLRAAAILVLTVRVVLFGLGSR
ncbi:MAG: sugar transferase [Pseudomonadota bacterium]